MITVLKLQSVHFAVEKAYLVLTGKQYVSTLHILFADSMKYMEHTSYSF